MIYPLTHCIESQDFNRTDSTHSVAVIFSCAFWLISVSQLQCSFSGLLSSWPCSRLSELRLEDSGDDPDVSRLRFDVVSGVFGSQPSFCSLLGSFWSTSWAQSELPEPPDDWETVSQDSLRLGPTRCSSAGVGGQRPARTRGVLVHSFSTADL